MGRRTLIAVAVSAGALVAAPSAALAGPVGPGSGPHGCALGDAAGNSPPVVHDSDTSKIGGNSCVYTQVATSDGQSGGSYFAVAQTWSVTACTPGTDPVTGAPICTPDVSFSSANGDKPVGQGVIPVGDKVTVSVSNGGIIAGTPNGVTGA